MMISCALIALPVITLCISFALWVKQRLQHFWTGSSINIISRSFYDSVPETFKFDYQECAVMITMADNASIAVDGTVGIQLCTPSKKSHIVPVYIFRDTSHHIILRAEYMRSNNVVLDFSKNSVFPNMKKSQKVRCKNTCVIQPNTESVLEGKLSTDGSVGTQGVCLGHSEMSHKGLLVAKGLVTCLSDHIVPVRIWNPSNEIVHVNKSSILCTFSICYNFVDVHCISLLSNVRMSNFSQAIVPHLTGIVVLMPNRPDFFRLIKRWCKSR